MAIVTIAAKVPDRTLAFVGLMVFIDPSIVCPFQKRVVRSLDGLTMNLVDDGIVKKS